jgi:hypothetical protein
MKAVEFALDLLDEVEEFLGWREEWRRTSNPVAFWLALVGAAVLLLVAAVQAQSIWAYLRHLLGAGS